MDSVEAKTQNKLCEDNRMSGKKSYFKYGLTF